VTAIYQARLPNSTFSFYFFVFFLFPFFPSLPKEKNLNKNIEEEF
jgi:hypothetical protein